MRFPSNLGGIIGIPIVAYFSGQHSWHTAFVIGVGFAVVSAVAWLGIQVASPVKSGTPPLVAREAGAY